MSKRIVALLVLLALFLSGCTGEKAVKTAAPAEYYYAGDPHLYKTEYGLGRMQGSALAEQLTLRQRQLIVGYLDLYYEALATLKPCSFAELFLPTSVDSLAWNQAMLAYTVDQRLMQPQDLSLAEWKYTARISAVEQQNGSVTVTVEEDSEQVFAAWREITSERYDSWHQFTLQEQEGEWYIADHIDSLQEICREHWPNTDALTAERITELVSAETAKLEAVFAARTTGEHSAAECDHPYDREKAVAYAEQFWQRRNGVWADFSARGGNCQNYASQCLLEGGIPMDYEGEARWYSKRYEDFVESMEGRTTSWAAVRFFRDYAEKNRGYGLAAAVDRPYFSGEPGDILQMGVEEETHHTTVITRLLTDEQGNPVDYLLCSNTANLKDFPAAAYPYPYRNLIKIYGWNEN